MHNIHPSFIYELGYPDFFELEGFAEKSAQKLYDAIQKSKNLDFNKFLYGCGMPNVGRHASKDIAIHYSDSERFGVNNPAAAMHDDEGFETLKEIPGIGPEIINSLNKNWETHAVPFAKYIEHYLRVYAAKKAVNQITFVVTGEFDIKRNEIKALIESKGHKVAGSVSKKTDYLLASPGEESSSKYTKATDLGTKIINTIKELEDIINE